MSEEIKNHLLEVLNLTFVKKTEVDLNENYLRKIGNIKKWICCSDYCLDDQEKPNDVITFTLIPYILEFDQLSSLISNLAKVDIKKTTKIDSNFIDFLTTYPLINFSFIVNNRKELLGKNHQLVKKSLTNTFEYTKQQYIDWGKKQPEHKTDYDNFIKKIDCILCLINNDKKVKQIINMILVTFLGAYVSNKIINKMDVTNFCWLSDRDAINEVCDNSSAEFFQHFLHNFTDGKEFKFLTAPSTSKDDPFFDKIVRIPDYVAGTLADYDIINNIISKDKFDTMLSEYMAENTHNNFIFRLFIEDDKYSCSRIDIHKK